MNCMMLSFVNWCEIEERVVEHRQGDMFFCVRVSLGFRIVFFLERERVVKILREKGEGRGGGL